MLATLLQIRTSTRGPIPVRDRRTPPPFLLALRVSAQIDYGPVPRPARSRAYASPAALPRPSQGSLPAGAPLDDIPNFMNSSHDSLPSDQRSRIAKFDEVELNIDRALTAEPHDRKAWIATTVRLLRDEEWARQMKQKIRRFAEQTSWENVGKLHVDLYQRLIEGQS
jgi:hypothetical protein